MDDRRGASRGDTNQVHHFLFCLLLRFSLLILFFLHFSLIATINIIISNKIINSFAPKRKIVIITPPESLTPDPHPGTPPPSTSHPQNRTHF